MWIANLGVNVTMKKYDIGMSYNEEGPKFKLSSCSNAEWIAKI